MTSNSSNDIKRAIDEGIAIVGGVRGIPRLNQAVGCFNVAEKVPVEGIRRFLG